MFMILWMIFVIAFCVMISPNTKSNKLKKALDLEGANYTGKISRIMPPVGESHRQLIDVSIYRNGAISKVSTSTPIEYQYQVGDYVEVFVGERTAKIQRSLSRKEIDPEIKETLDRMVY